jgi:acetate CoA/acetoacetate CoA-transferase beta subunit
MYKAKQLDCKNEHIAKRAALEFADDQIVDLGLKMPMLIRDYVRGGVEDILQSENVLVMAGQAQELGKQKAESTVTGASPTRLLPGVAAIEIDAGFCIIHGGHIDAAIIRALEVDQEGSIAYWEMPVRSGVHLSGMGRAMELVGAARKVVAVLQHIDKNGKSAVLRKCRWPLTGKSVVKTIITEKAVFEVTPDGLVLKEIVAGITFEQLAEMTDAEFTISKHICYYRR